MEYLELAPAPALRPFVEAFWRFRVGEAPGVRRHVVPLTGGLMLTVAPRARQAWVFGPRVEPLHKDVQPHDEYWGVNFWPGAGVALLGVDVSRDGAAEATALLGAACIARLGRATERQGRALLDAALTPRLGLARPRDLGVARAVKAIVASDGACRIAQLAQAVRLSPRQLRRRFLAACGLSPKELARVRRVRALALALAQDEQGWADLAAGHGYADQAHLSREVRRLLGVEARALGRHVRSITHAAR